MAKSKEKQSSSAPLDGPSSAREKRPRKKVAVTSARPTVPSMVPPEDEVGVATLARQVADSLHRFRRERQLSLDDLAARSGVSRAALSQIEGARTNPTLAVLWKIANGLRVPFHDLLSSRPAGTLIVQRASDAPLLTTSDGNVHSRLLSPGGSNNDTEVYELRFSSQAKLSSEAHARGTTETLVLLVGSLRLTAGEETCDLSAGDSATFRADVEHSYENRSTRETRLLNVIHYSRTANG
jgi:XRE family transcriptional regulator, regulator of sulfur utilization